MLGAYAKVLKMSMTNTKDSEMSPINPRTLGKSTTSLRVSTNLAKTLRDLMKAAMTVGTQRYPGTTLTFSVRGFFNT